MKVENFIISLIEEFPQVDDSNIKPEDSLFDTFGWSSLNILLIRAKILDEYEVKLSDKQIKQSNTIQELFNLIQNNVV